MTTNRIFIFLILLAAGAAAMVAAAPFSLSDNPGKAHTTNILAPHLATYKIQMVSRESGSQVLNVSGNMTYEWQQDCEAWTTDHAFELYYEYTDSMPVKINSHFSTYETFAGDEFSFNVTRKRNGRIFEELRGRAFESDDKYKAIYSKPAGLEFSLPAETFFPSDHTLEMIKHIKKGETFFNAIVFDGSDDEGPVEINSFLGRETQAEDHITLTPDIDIALLNTKAYAVRMAFFPYFKSTAESEYEMNAILHENGVISHMEVEYNDFSVTQTLTSLKPISEPRHCENSSEL